MEDKLYHKMFCHNCSRFSYIRLLTFEVPVGRMLFPYKFGESVCPVTLNYYGPCHYCSIDLKTHVKTLDKKFIKFLLESSRVGE